MEQVVKHRFALLAAFAFAAVLITIWAGDYWGDYWHHAAVVKELTTHLVHPRNPVLSTLETHHFFSPYSVVLGFVARQCRLTPIEILAVMAVVNYWLFICAFCLFVKSLIPEKHEAVKFYGLLFILFWWGSDAWSWGGFFHINALRLTASYPSTLAISLSMLGVAIHLGRLKARFWTKAALVTLITSLVILIHPPTFIFLAAMLMGTSLAKNPPILRSAAYSLVLIAISLFISTCWPYFSILDLVTHVNNEFHQSHHLMYEQVLIRTWPVLLLSLVVGLQTKFKWRKEMAIPLLLLVAVYLLGFVFGSAMLGRTISFIVILLHLINAEQAAIWERGGARYRTEAPAPGKKILAGLVICSLVFSANPLWFAASLIAKPLSPPKCQISFPEKPGGAVPSGSH